MLQERRRCFPHSLLPHAHFRGHSSVLHGAGFGPIPEGRAHICVEDMSLVKGTVATFI